MKQLQNIMYLIKAILICCPLIAKDHELILDPPDVKTT